MPKQTLYLIDYTSYSGNPEPGAMTIGSGGTIYGATQYTVSGNVSPPFSWSGRILRYQVDWNHLEANGVEAKIPVFWPISTCDQIVLARG